MFVKLTKPMRLVPFKFNFVNRVLSGRFHLKVIRKSQYVVAILV